MRMKMQAALSVAALLALGAGADEAASDISENAQAFRADILEMTGSFIEDAESPYALGYWNQLVSMAGREDLIADVDPRTSRNCAEIDGDPIKTLAEMAAETSIVIINEDHARPAHREFIATLAERLRADGYEYYAAESFSHDITERPTGPSTVADGYYVRDPVYGRLLETVRTLGYTLIPYEIKEEQRAAPDADTDTQIDTRETAQVDNLLGALLAEKPDARVLIHVGHSHVAERPVPDENGTLWMAARLKARTGIDPLTISQTMCEAGGPSPVLSDAAIGTERYEPFTDILVGQPANEFKDGRPAYRYDNGAVGVEVPEALLPTEAPILIEARPVGAADNVVPADRLYLRPGETLPLVLAPGTYEVRSFDEAGVVAGPETVEVSGGP